MKYRLARPEDASEILKIYRPYIEKTAITFEYEIPTVEEFTERIIQTSTIFPYIVATEDGKILGYAYASRYRERKAYDWVVELSIYVDENTRHQHVGSELYQRLLSALKFLNYQRAYACITHPNPGSQSFHEKFGFQKIGIMQKSGYKFDQWYGIEWMDIALQESDKVRPIRKMSELTEDEIKTILA